jgi:hypothetical protein
MSTKLTLSKDAYLDLKLPRTDYPNEFIQFCEHHAYPSTLRKYKDNKSFSRAYHISQNTLTQWTKTPEFNDNIRIITKQIIGNDLPKIMEVVKKQALSGSSKHTDILLKWLGELQQAETVIDKAVVFKWDGVGSGSTKPIDSTIVDDV